MTTIDGIDLITSQGSKFPGDLRLDVRGTDGQWRPVTMAMAFFLIDFFTENEQERGQYEGHWRRNGDMYFIDACIGAVRDGWRAAADKVRRQRERRAS